MNKPRGFAALNPEQRRIVASKGGKSISPDKRSFSVNRTLAREAGSKGGKSKRR